MNTMLMEVWHRRLGHVNMKTVEHLPQAFNDVKIIKPRYQLICRIRYRVGHEWGHKWGLRESKTIISLLQSLKNRK